jgi:lia operon protein LiaG
MARLSSPAELALTALALVAFTSSAQAQRADRRTLSGKHVAIYNLVGSIKAEGASSRDEVSVEITRRGDDSDRLRIESGPIGGRETLRVIFPEGRIRYEGERGRRGFFGDSRTTMYVKEDGTFGGDDSGWGRGRKVEISARDGIDAAADVRVFVPRGQQISLYLGAGEATISNVDGDIMIDVQQAAITTNGTRGALKVDGGGGSVQVTDAEGDVDIDTGSGGATLTRLHGETLRIDTGSGSVKGSSIDAGRLDVDTGSGGVQLSGVKSRDIVLDTGSGSVELALTDDIESLRIDSGSGGVTLWVPRSLGAQLEAETGSGGVDIDIPFEMRRSERGKISGRIGDGRGRISIDTGSGGVRIRPATSSER